MYSDTLTTKYLLWFLSLIHSFRTLQSYHSLHPGTLDRQDYNRSVQELRSRMAAGFSTP